MTQLTPKQLLHGFIALFYPHLCLACEKEQPPLSDIICIKCQYKLPRTEQHLQTENAFTERFWGRIPLQAGAAMYHFVKGGAMQRLLHHLKYKGRKEVGSTLGEWYGQLLRNAPAFQDIDLIVPVPIHPRKKRIRGYNQSDHIAEGLAKSMQKPWLPDGLQRVEHTQSQTTKSRMERFENVMRAFAVKNATALQGKHILLVDDVLTTGATLEACALKLLDVPDTKVSMATLAMATH